MAAACCPGTLGKVGAAPLGLLGGSLACILRVLSGVLFQQGRAGVAGVLVVNSAGPAPRAASFPSRLFLHGTLAGLGLALCPRADTHTDSTAVCRFFQ